MNSKRNYLNNSNIEIINPKITRGKIKFAIFDFDGTISLIREGWQQIMIPMMVDILVQTPAHESRTEIEKIVRIYIANTTGKQTIYQMIRLTEEIEKRGGAPQEPHDVTCFLASGTDEKYVFDEAELLGVSKYFASIYGALDDYESFSKRMVIQKIIKDNQLSGPELVAFGDGYVEIEDTKAFGGIAVGIATNEAERQGIDEWKRERLISSGADIIMPEFRQYQTLIDYLMMEE
jgi:phosphoglycolate phosphatase-like HAD superfamily hydrolase